MKAWRFSAECGACGRVLAVEAGSGRGATEAAHTLLWEAVVEHANLACPGETALAKHVMKDGMGTTN